MAQERDRESDTIALPKTIITEQDALGRLLQQRRSLRDFQPGSLILSEVGRLLWAAQGITHPDGLRTAPSAGALYPLELYLVAGQVDGLAPGIYHYEPRRHQLTLTESGDHRKVLAHAAYGQSWMEGAAVMMAFTAAYQRTSRKYGQRGERYVHIEVGHAVENLFLQAEAMGLGSVVVGAFDDEEIARHLRLPPATEPLIIMPVGKR